LVRRGRPSSRHLLGRLRDTIERFVRLVVVVVMGLRWLPRNCGSSHWPSGCVVTNFVSFVTNFVSFVTSFVFAFVTTSVVVTTRSLLVPLFCCVATDCRAIAAPFVSSACDFVRTKPRGRSQSPPGGASGTKRGRARCPGVLS